MSVPTSALEKGMMTHSGAMVSMRDGVPSLEDIALALSRIPRFGGHCRTPWTVLNHSLVCERIARDMGVSRYARLACLLHDAHEAITGDVPSPLKVPQIKVLQGKLDDRIYRAHFPWPVAYWDTPLVHEVDYRALLAEAVTVGPPGIGWRNVVELFGAEPQLRDIRIVQMHEEDTSLEHAINDFFDTYAALTV